MRKDRRIPALEELPRIFDDKFIRSLAHKAKLPLHADIECFATLIRNAARQYLADMTIPGPRAIRDGIKALYSAAKRYRYKETATRISKVPEQTRAFMKVRGDNLGLALPEPEAFRDCATRDEACETIVRLLRVGWEGDKPLLYTPKPPSHPPRREAELDFVTGLRLAYLHATGEPPAYTANPERPGPFARMVQACLVEIAPWANAVELLKELQRRRKPKKPSQSGTAPKT